MKRVLALILSLLFVMTMLPAVSLATDAISVVTPPKKVTYLPTETVDTTGIEVWYNETKLDGGFTVAAVDSTLYKDNKFTAAAIGKAVKFIVTYDNGTAKLVDYFEVNVVEQRLGDLVVNSLPVKAEYAVGDAPDLTGLTVSASYVKYDATAKKLVTTKFEMVACTGAADPKFTLKEASYTFPITAAGATAAVGFNFIADATATFSGSVDLRVVHKKATSVTLSKSTLDMMLSDAAVALTATPDPSNATDLTFSTSDASVATVTVDPATPLVANVKPTGVGTAVITVKNADGTVSATCTVTVTKSASDVKIVDAIAGKEISSYDIITGAEHKLTAETDPLSAQSHVKWQVLTNQGTETGKKAIDEAVFESSGTIVALYPGTATVKATCDTKESQVVTINVADAVTSTNDYTFIQVDGVGTKCYMVGEYFDPATLDVRAYVGGEANDETLGDVLKVSDFSYTVSLCAQSGRKQTGISAYPFNGAGDATITLYYTFNYKNPTTGKTTSKTLTTSVKVHVYLERPFMVVIGEAPLTSAYYLGEKLDSKGLSLKVAYTTAKFGAASPEISSYQTLAIDNTSIPALYDKISADDVAAGFKDYEIVFEDAYGTVATPAKLTVNAYAPIAGLAVDPAQLTFTYESIATALPQTFTITVPQNTPESAIAWATSNPKAASYTYTYNPATGIYTVTVIPLAPGTTTISVAPRGSANDIAADMKTCTVTVKGDPDEDVLAMKLNYQNYTLLIGATYALVPQFTPVTASDDIAWAIVDPTTLAPLASSDGVINDSRFTKEGILEGLKVGSIKVRATTINAKDSAGNPFVDYCTVNVVAIAVDTMTLSDTALNLYGGSSYVVSATVTPDNATDKTVAWTTSDETSAVEYTLNGVGTSVAANPIVTVEAIDANSARIKTDAGRLDAYLKTKNATEYKATVYAVAYGGLTKTCTVVLKKGTLMTDLVLNKHSVELAIGENVALTASITPSAATNKNLEWTSSVPGVATVDDSGYVTAVGPGVTTITAAAMDGSGKQDTCTVQIASVLIQSVTVSPYVSTIAEEGTLQLTANLYPANVSSTKVAWSSLDKSIATVDANGLVTGQGGGVAIIRATSADGSNVYGSAVVAVKAKIPVKSVDISLGDFELLLNDSTILKCTYNPTDATNTAVTWRTSNAGVATVDKDGKIVGVALGTANITAVADKKSDTITVSVVSALTRSGKVVNCSRRVNVRSSASGTSKALGYAYLGTRYKVLGQVGNWYKIQYSSTKVGYIWAKYLELSSSSGSYVSAGVTAGTATPNPSTGTTTNPTKVTITNCNEFVNVRSGPGTSHTKLGTANVNTSYVYTATEGDWIKLVYNGVAAYIYKDYCLLS